MTTPTPVHSSSPPFEEEDQGAGCSPQPFACQRCGNCCRHSGEVRLVNGEAESIAAMLGNDTQTFTARYTRLREDRHGLALLDNPDGSCIFLSSEALGNDNTFPMPPKPPPPSLHSLCHIQSAKPQQCRNFPFTWRYENLTAICPASRQA